MDRMQRYLAAAIILMAAGMAATGAVAVQESRQGPVLGDPVFNATGPDLANRTIPPAYGISPSPVEVGVEITGTQFPGPKGEMVMGPRSIAFSTGFAGLVVIAVAVLGIGAAVWYLAGRKPEETDEQEEQ